MATPCLARKVLPAAAKPSALPPVLRPLMRPGKAGCGPEPDDDALMTAVAQGNAVACAQLVDRHLPRIVNLAARILGDPAEAEDVAQEAFLRVWRKADEWQAGRARLTTWLHRVTVNLCIDRKRRPRGVALDTLNDLRDPAPASDTLAHRRQTARRVQQALLTLPERQRIAIVLCHHQGHSNGEAAEILGIKVDALESLLSRGRKSLCRMLASEAEQLLDDD